MDQWDPRADERATSTVGNARFTVLTDRLIRLEWAEDGRFEDRATRAVICRRQPVPEFEVRETKGGVVIDTGAVELTYSGGGDRFDPTNLRAAIRFDGETADWRPGMADAGNLGGTVRTLDGVSGSCPVEPGLLSRDGWALHDDSDALVFDGGDWNWVTTRGDRDVVDWYLFAHGRDYLGALRDFTAVSGRIPLPPKYVLGSWFSRYWPYTDEQYRAIIDEYDAHGVGIDVLVLDMDWHLDSWTGYTWNPRYFPEPERFLDWAHERGLRITLNLHPADGVGKHESMFREMREAVGGGREMYRVPFDCGDQRFMRAYFDVLHRPLETMGVDFWWMDWQQGTSSSIPGLDPLWWLNHLHWEDMERNPDRGDLRPLIFSRWGGLGNHRYPIGFSGDTFNDWDSLAWQPEFTAMAGNVGYAYWSHDIGGHQPGPVDDELYARWVQYGVFSPALRLHSGREPKAERRIWTFRPDCFDAMRAAFAWRYRLLPYIYTECRRTFDESVPLCRPLYYEWPDEDGAYAYLFGDELLVAPVVRALDGASHGALVDAWIPPGRWTAWMTGRTYDGPGPVRMLVPLDETPVLVRAGGVVVEGPDVLRANDRPLDEATINVFPGDRGSYRLYEDDGLTRGYERGDCAWTMIDHETRPDGARVVRIAATDGAFDGAPAERALTFRLHGSWPAASVELDGAPVATGVSYDAEDLAVVVRTGPRDVSAPLELVVRPVEPASDGHAIAAGLKGHLRLIDDLAETLGDEAPVALAEASTIRGLIETDADRAASLAASLQGGWWSLVGAIDACGASAARRRSALARLLGLSCDVAVERVFTDAGDVAVRADVAFAPRFDGMGEVGVSIDLEPDDGWRIDDAGDLDHATLGVGRHAHRRWTVAEDASLAGLGPGGATVCTRITAGPAVIELADRVGWRPSINGWWVVGPFFCPFDDQPTTEPADHAALDPATPVAYDGETVEWRRVEQHSAPGADPMRELRVDLNEVLDGPHEHAVAYALCTLISPDDREAELAIGSDDGPRVWLNGDLVHEKHVSRGYRSREDRVLVRLRKGRNRLVVRIGQQLAGWAFGAHVLDATGRVMTDIRVELPDGG